MSECFVPAVLTHLSSEYAAGAHISAGGIERALNFGPALVAEAPAPAGTGSAEKAVEVVLEAVERLGRTEQRSVQLNFSVGDADLNVRVELHDDEVRTTFRTDSSDLREALSHEWQSVAAVPVTADRPFRIGAAVFTTADQAAAGAFSGDGAQRDSRQPSSRRSPGGRSESTFSSRASAPVGTRTVERSAAHAGNSLHLHTLA